MSSGKPRREDRNGANQNIGSANHLAPSLPTVSVSTEVLRHHYAQHAKTCPAAAFGVLPVGVYQCDHGNLGVWCEGCGEFLAGALAQWPVWCPCAAALALGGGDDE